MRYIPVEHADGDGHIEARLQSEEMAISQSLHGSPQCMFTSCVSSRAMKTTAVVHYSLSLVVDGF